MHGTRTYALLLLGLIAGAASMEAPHYIRWDDIRGESTDEGHKDWINLDSASFSLWKNPDNLSSPPQFSEMVIGKRTDVATPWMVRALVTGAVVPEMELDITRSTGQGQSTYQNYRLKDVIISSYSVNSGNTTDAPSETFALTYNYIESTYWQLDDEGVVLFQARSFWDIPTNKGGESGGNEPPTINPISGMQVESASPIDVLIIINEKETPPDQLEVTVESDRPDLILDLAITGNGLERTLSFRASALYSGFGVITIRVSDGVHQTSLSFAVMIGTQMTPFEAFMAAYFTPAEMADPQLVSPIGDPDEDNIPTIVEYALVTNPREYTLPHQALKVTRENTEAGPVIRLNYRRRTDDPNVRPIPWMAPESLLFSPIHNNPLYEESGKTGENPFYDDVEGVLPIDPDGADVHMIRMQVDVE